ncbi:hypothetical protein JHK82_027824 [Glycine max]|nr:hypothetical protein JHK82_027824 [Glycine max]
MRMLMESETESGIVYKRKGERKDIELVEEEEPRIGADCSSATSNKYEIYKEEAGNATQKHKAKRVESVNADAEAFDDHWESSNCSMHFEAEALEHMKKRDRGHQSVSLENKTGDSTVVKMSEKNNNVDAGDCMILDDHEGEEHCCGKGTNARSEGEHKYGFNNNKREKPEKVKVVDDETGDKHELYEVLRMPSRTKN